MGKRLIVSIRESIDCVVHKHLAGQHNQKRHGWRYGGLPQARRSMMGASVQERSRYRKRAGMPMPQKKMTREEKYLLNLVGDRTPSYHDVGSVKNAHQEFHSTPEWQQWHNSLSDEDVWAIKQYTSYDYVGSGISYSQRPFYKLNTSLRNKTFDESAYPNSSLTKMANALDRATRENSLHRDMMLYRACSSSNLFQKAGDGSIGRGSIIQDLGYASTTPARETADRFHQETMASWGEGYPVYMRIKALRGTKGAYISHASYNKYMTESEFLLPRGTKFVVENVGYEMINGYQTAVYDLIAITEQE